MGGILEIAQSSHKTALLQGTGQIGKDGEHGYLAIIARREQAQQEDTEEGTQHLYSTIVESSPQKPSCSLLLQSACHIRMLLNRTSAQWYEPEQLVGTRVLFIANLAPRKIMGEESHGMILSAVNYDGNLSVTTTLGDVKGGSTVE